jgi:formate dehydrogenase iron-sulfur subunit
VAFGLFAALAALHAASTVAVAAPPWLTRGLGASVVIAGSAGVACSVLLYAATRRRWWRGPRLAVLFSASALVTASAALLVVVTVAAASDRAALTAVRPLIALLVVTTVVKLAVESIVLRHRHADRRARPGRPLDPATLELHRTARLLTDDLAPMVGRRVAAGLAGGVLVPLVLLAVTSPSGPPSVAVAVGCSVVALVLVVAAELTERRLFFLAMSGPRMPGVLR